MTKRKQAVRERFEAWWIKQHPQEHKSLTCDWLERSSLWDRGGYAQPCVSGDWKIWEAAYRAALRAKGEKRGK